MFQFQSFKATESFKIAATGNGGLLEQKKKKKKERKKCCWREQRFQQDVECTSEE